MSSSVPDNEPSNQPLESPKLPSQPEFEHPEKAKNKHKIVFVFVLSLLLILIAGLGIYGYHYYFAKNVATASSKQVGAADQYVGWKLFTDTSSATSGSGISIKYPVNWHFDKSSSNAYAWRIVQTTDPKNSISLRYVSLDASMSPQQEWSTCNNPDACGAAPSDSVLQSEASVINGLNAYSLKMQRASGIYHAIVIKETPSANATSAVFIEFILNSNDSSLVNLYTKIAQSAKYDPSKATANPYVGWIPFSSSADHFSVKYPPSWTLDVKNGPAGTVSLDGATWTSPSKTVLHMYADTGGKGGGPCIPAPQDVPFKHDNLCTTLEYLTSERLPVDNLYYMYEVPNVDPVKFLPKQAPVYLVTTHWAYREDSYGISIAETTTPQDTFAVNTPYMGSDPSYTWLTLYDAKGKGYPYVYLYANGDSPSFLTSEDASTIKNIIRSFTLNI